VPSFEPIVESIRIRAAPQTVFRYFTDPSALMEWMGERAEVEPRAGGRFVVDIRGEIICGEYVEVTPPTRLRITWGRVGSSVLPPGSSQLDIRLDSVSDGTLVTLAHHGLPLGEAGLHREGWRFFLRHLARVCETGVKDERELAD
jgi:uncharacterized protein YndB with AHSA1/START domain